MVSGYLFFCRAGSVIVNYLLFFKPGTDVTGNGSSLSTNFLNMLNKTGNNASLGRFTIDASRVTQGGNVVVLCWCWCCCCCCCVVVVVLCCLN